MGRGTGSVWITHFSTPGFLGTCPFPLPFWVLSNEFPRSAVSLVTHSLWFRPGLLWPLVAIAFTASAWMMLLRLPGEAQGLSSPPLPFWCSHLWIVAWSEEVTCLFYISGRPSAAWVFPKRGDFHLLRAPGYNYSQPSGDVFFKSLFP